MRYWYKSFELLKAKDSLIFYKTPTNLTYWWNFGVLSLYFFIIQLVFWIFLTMFYDPSILYAFSSIMYINNEKYIINITILLLWKFNGIYNVLSNLNIDDSNNDFYSTLVHYNLLLNDRLSDGDYFFEERKLWFSFFIEELEIEWLNIKERNKEKIIINNILIELQFLQYKFEEHLKKNV